MLSSEIDLHDQRQNQHLHLVNRRQPVFVSAWNELRSSLLLEGKRVLVVGGAGSIGSAVTELLFGLSPAALHVVDVNENALADLVRQIRSTVGYCSGDFRTICFDPLHAGASAFVQQCGPYDIVLNFAAVKHVRSEKDQFTLSRMFAVNVQLMKQLTLWANEAGAQTLFSVSTDKAANPANLMGASKRLMEMIGFAYGNGTFSSARFANVAFSNGSLLKALLDRIERGQPISAPSNIRRFFITHDEAARLCLLAALQAPRGTIAIPRAPGEIELTSFVDVVTNLLASRGYTPRICSTEEEARSIRPTKTEWPCYFFESDTSGEKPFEEFVGIAEELVESPFEDISLVGKLVSPKLSDLEAALAIDPLTMNKNELVKRVAEVVPGFSHIETGKNLDQRM